MQHEFQWFQMTYIFFFGLVIFVGNKCGATGKANKLDTSKWFPTTPNDLNYSFRSFILQDKFKKSF